MKALLFVLLVLFDVTYAYQQRSHQWEKLYVWTGSTAGDHVAVVDYSPKSRTYGRVLQRVFLPTNDTSVSPTGNEPHHMGITSDGRWLAAGGLTSFLQGKNEVFVFSIDRVDGSLKFAYSLDVPGACTDEFIPHYDHNRHYTDFIISMMCNETGGSPGTYVRFRPSTRTFYQWDTYAGKAPPNLNPHGAQYDPIKGLLGTDYVLPITLFGPPNEVVFRDTLRYYNHDGSFNGTIQMPTKNSGYMDVKYIPGDKKNKAITMTGSPYNLIFLVDPIKKTAKNIFSLASVSKGNVDVISTGISQITSDGKRFIQTYAMRWVILFSIDYNQKTDVHSISLLDSFDMCNPPRNHGLSYLVDVCASTNNKPGPHYIKYDERRERFIVVNYFLRVGVAYFPGSQTIHSFDLVNNRRKLRYDVRFAPNLSINKKTKAYPHSVGILHRG